MLTCTALLGLAGCGSSEEAPSARDATVDFVVDGDSLELLDGAEVRLVQIDAPERNEDECYSREAERELQRLLPDGAHVRLESDPRLDNEDRFGRLLRYAFRDSANVNVELVARGAATVWFVGGDRGRYADELLSAGRTARREGRGLWAACVAKWDPYRGAETEYPSR